MFQLAIGGGEPFAREDFPDLVQHAASAGLSVHITTGMYHLEPGLIEALSRSAAALNIGIPPHILPDHRKGTRFRELIEKLQTTVTIIRDAGIVPGVNLVLTKSIIPQLEFILEQLMNIGNSFLSYFLHLIISVRYIVKNDQFRILAQ